MTTQRHLENLVVTLCQLTNQRYTVDYMIGGARLQMDGANISPRLSRGKLAAWIGLYIAGWITAQLDVTALRLGDVRPAMQSEMFPEATCNGIDMFYCDRFKKNRIKFEGEKA